MSRPVYLALHPGGPNSRTHFAVFIPHASLADTDLSASSFKDAPCTGTIVQVVGEPLMSGYALEFKRNFDCSTAHDLRKLVLLGTVDEKHIHDSGNVTGGVSVVDAVPRSRLETEASRVPPPPKGQDMRLPIDGVNTKRCQEWTMEFIRRLVGQGLIQAEAVDIVQSHRDSPTRGIIGMKRNH
ncbi:hypothetical protein JDV02_002787 [Purpureocillium takamizusanense]|uniref:Uncharacterized protein n=1 Tax=Purpureocillium takamizusanense TaxID=2060973 RepID=A0A9Q8QB22_9HYPO|nr:uncharacterized protein JDV02_002787 [Purpureocillium takamizusanense]UNI16350.1 hypothetical protein JDV02_002787 [Purpureocillium takamizusanense]